MSHTSKGSKVSRRFRERAKEFNAKIEREKLEIEMNEIFINLLKKQKKYEQSLAPMVFPILEREKRKKMGYNYSEVSTPPSTVLQSQQESRMRSKMEFQTDPGSRKSRNLEARSQREKASAKGDKLNDSRQPMKLPPLNVNLT